MAAPRRHHRALTVHETELGDLEDRYIEQAAEIMAAWSAVLEAHAVKAWSVIVGDLDKKPTKGQVAELNAWTKKQMRRTAPKVARELAAVQDRATKAGAQMAKRHLRLESGTATR